MHETKQAVNAYPGNGGVAYANAQNAAMPRAVPLVERAQCALNEATNTLHVVISELESRLGPVLGPSQVNTKDTDRAPTPSSVAGQVEASARAAEGAAQRLRGLLERLEI